MLNIETCICGCFVFDETASRCVKCRKNRKQAGRPKQSETKKPFSLRLSNDVIDIIRSKKNQQAYIEDLVRKDKT